MDFTQQIVTQGDVVDFIVNLEMEGLTFDFESDIEDLGIFSDEQIPFVEARVNECLDVMSIDSLFAALVDVRQANDDMMVHRYCA